MEKVTNEIIEKSNENRPRITPQEQLVRFRRKINGAKREVDMAETPQQATTAIGNLAMLVASAKTVKAFKAIVPNLNDLDEMITSVQNYHKTRHDLELMIQIVLKRLNELIEQELKNERAAKLNRFFQECAKHSKRIVEIINLDGIVE